MRIKVQDKQTIFDIALQYAGSIDAVNEILIANNKSNDTLVMDEELEIPSIHNNAIATYFKQHNIVIATEVQRTSHPSPYLITQLNDMILTQDDEQILINY